MRLARLHVGLGVVVVALVAVGVFVSPDVVLGYVEATLWSPWFPLVLVALYAVRPLLAWPITALSVLVGYRYGVVVGVPVALVGAVATSLVPYAVARSVRTDAGVIGRAVDGSERFFDVTGELRGVIAARLAPTPAEVISVAAGAGRVPVWAFVLGTTIGELPWTIAAVLAGRSMRRLSTVGFEATNPVLLAGGLLAAVVLLAVPAYRVVHDRLDRRARGA